MIQIPDDKDDTTDRTIEAANGKAIGGIVGINETQGKIEVTAKGTATEVVAVGSDLRSPEKGKSAESRHKRRSDWKRSQTADLTCKAKLVRASHGIVGGIVGETKKDILHAVNRCTNVTADAGTAGGITAENHSGQTIGNCKIMETSAAVTATQPASQRQTKEPSVTVLYPAAVERAGSRSTASVKKKSEPSVRSTAARSVEVIRKEM